MASGEPAGAVDFGYLEGFTAGDRQVISEVLTLFLGQAKVWVGGLNPDNPDWRDLVHTVKGSARGVGANALGEVCAQAEINGPDNLPAVRDALAAAVAEMVAYQARR